MLSRLAWVTLCRCCGRGGSILWKIVERGGGGWQCRHCSGIVPCGNIDLKLLYTKCLAAFTTLDCIWASPLYLTLSVHTSLCPECQFTISSHQPILKLINSLSTKNIFARTCLGWYKLYFSQEIIYCQAQFQLVSSVPVERRLALSLNINIHPHPPPGR